MKESESRQHAPRDLETGSHGGNLSGNLKSKPLVHQCILYVLFQDVETGFHSVPLNAFVFFFELHPSKVLVDITIADKVEKITCHLYSLVM